MEEFNKIQEIIENYILEKTRLQQEIKEIEEQRMTLAEQRNTEKYRKKDETFSTQDNYKIHELGNKINTLGNQSQFLENEIIRKFIEAKNNIIQEITIKMYSILIQNATLEIDLEHKENIKIIDENEKKLIEIKSNLDNIRKSRWLQLSKMSITKKIEENNVNSIEREQITFDTVKGETNKVIEYKKDINVNIIDILVKIENNSLIYVAHLSNGDNIEKSVYQLQSLGKEELKNMLINYSILKYKVFDKSVIKKIDIAICQLVIEIAKKYNLDEKEFLYNYTMSFSKKEGIEIGEFSNIMYNISFIEDSQLDVKIRKKIKKICQKSRKNNRISVIGYTNKIAEIIYSVKRNLNHNKIKRLAQAKE